MAKFREITLPDGTKKLERILKTPEEIEQDKELHEKIKQREQKRKSNKPRFRIKVKSKSESWFGLHSDKYNEDKNEDKNETDGNDNDSLGDDFKLEMPDEEKFKQVFLSLVDRNGENGCWIWKGCIKKFSELNGELNGMEYAHVVSYKLFKGKIDDAKYPVHKCENPICVNPHHIFMSSYPETYDICAVSEDINPRYIVKV